MAKFIFVTGGVISGLGKGITAASLGRLLKARGLKVVTQKLDPYVNVDPGTMSPYQHGEVFVTEDGTETDLDLGHYERFIDENLTKYSNLTSGRVFSNVIAKEREGGYGGQMVQMIPHVTDEIKSFIYAGAQSAGTDVLITEIGGTTGDIESRPFLEAIRQISNEAGRRNCLFIHVILIPLLQGQHKSKPAQHSVRGLRAMGISPDVVVARADEPLKKEIIEKLSMFCDVNLDCVIENVTLSCLYEAPMTLHKEGLDDVVCRALSLPAAKPDLSEWEKMLVKVKARKQSISIAIVGKYVRLHDAYLSIMEALSHAGFEHGAQVDILWVDSETVHDRNVGEILGNVNGILVPGGFGIRGTEGMITACRYARENDIPYLGICLGMQIAVIEFARNVCGLEEATSGEFGPDAEHKVIDLMEEQESVVNKGGTMRLGAYPCEIVPRTLLAELYQRGAISERHRHRYEFNNRYRERLGANGMVLCGMSPDHTLVEAVELPAHSFFIGVQFHPEFKSRPNRAHPLFAGFVKQGILARTRTEGA
jgi:CTP synthase